MGKVSESWRDVRNRKAVQEFGGADRVGVPEVSELMCGKPNATGTGWERPPLSLLLYLEGDQVKFCFSAKEFPMQLWGTVSSFKDIIENVEDALCKERCDWKKKREDENGYAHRSR